MIDAAGTMPPEFAYIAPETATSEELGLKGNFGDQRGRFAVDVFRQIYKDFQQDFANNTIADKTKLTDLNQIPVPTNLAASILNAKEAEVRGVEASLAWLLQDDWTVELNTAFTDSKFTDFKNAMTSATSMSPVSTGVYSYDTASCGTQVTSRLYPVCDFSGQRLPLVSRWAGNITSNYSLPAFDGADWYLNSLINFQSDQIDKVTRQKLGGYSTVDLFTGLRASKGNTWDVSLWVKNVFDRRAIVRIYRKDVPTKLNDPTSSTPGVPTPGAPTFDLVQGNLPRQIGMTGTYRF